MVNSCSVMCLLGPTAVGKTQLAIKLAQHFPFEIISVDSAMIYRGMDIGTAKPDKVTLERFPHHLIDICDPSDHYSVGQFLTDVDQHINAIKERGNWPLLVGGTMMYFRLLERGLANLPKASSAIRRELGARAEKLGWPFLHAELCALDPSAGNRIKPNDSQRIQRALEVYHLTGQSLSSQQTLNKKTAYKLSFIGIAPKDREQHRQGIAERFNNMLDQGLIKEVEALWKRGDLAADLPSVRCVGYRQIWAYLYGEMSYEEMREKAIIATRQLAKRQLTWLRSFQDISLFAAEDPELYEKVATVVGTLAFFSG